jgi:uncharacterized protein (DUF983 family)
MTRDEILKALRAASNALEAEERPNGRGGYFHCPACAATGYTRREIDHRDDCAACRLDEAIAALEDMAFGPEVAR